MADGFNTEGSECLHINLAKLGYNSSNKKAYVKQTTVWLRQQESIHQFCLYLQWAIPGYVAETLSDRVDEDDEGYEGCGGDNNDGEAEEDDGEFNLSECHDASEITYTIAKSSALPQVTIPFLVQDFVQFIPQNLPSFQYTNSSLFTYPSYMKLVLESPVRSSYLVPQGSNRDRDQLGFVPKPKIT